MGIPRLPYLTILDYYAIGSVLVTFLIMSQIFVCELMNIEQDDEGGSVAGIVIGCLFAAKQIVFVFWGWKARKYETSKLQMDGFDFKNLKGYSEKESTKSTQWYIKRNNTCVDEKLSASVRDFISDECDYPNFKAVKEKNE